MAKYLIGNIKGPKGDRGEAGPTYTAGEGISIQNNVISATGSGGITTETDPVFSASPAAGITAQDITDWNAKSDFSGSYNDLTNKPDLTVYATTTALGTGLARKQDTLTAGTNITIDANNVISAAGGGGSSDPKNEIYEASSIDETGLAEVITAIRNANANLADMPMYVRVGHRLFVLSTYGGLNFSWGFVAYTCLNAFHKNDNTHYAYMYPDQFLIRLSTGKVEYSSTNGSITMANTSDIPTPDGTTITDNNGVWSAVGGGSSAEELPSYTTGDAGKVLTVNSTEDGVEWTTPSGGGGNTEIYNPLLPDLGTNNWDGPTTKEDFLSQLKQQKLVYCGYTLGTNSPTISASDLTEGRDSFILVGQQVDSDGKVSWGQMSMIWPQKYKYYYLVKGHQKDTLYQFNSPDAIWAAIPILLSPRGSQTSLPTIKSLLDKKQNAITATNAPSSLFLKDSNNQVYEITVDTSGTLTATAVSNS